MILKHYNLENEISFDDNAIWTLVCESPRQFSQLTHDFCVPSKQRDDGWALYDGKRLDVDKYVECLVDFHNTNINDKKSAGILLDKLKQLAFDEKHTVITHEVLSKLTSYLTELSIDLDFPTRVNEMDFGTILKSVSVSFLDEAENLCEKLMDYVTLLSRLTIIKLLVCVNLRSYLANNELESFFHHCEQCGIYLLCIESHCKEKLSCEKVLFSDEDMCEFFPS